MKYDRAWKLEQTSFLSIRGKLARVFIFFIESQMVSISLIKVGKTTKDTHTSYIAIDTDEYADGAEARRAVCTGRSLNDKYVDGLLTLVQKATLQAGLVAQDAVIDLTT